MVKYKGFHGEDNNGQIFFYFNKNKNFNGGLHILTDLYPNYKLLILCSVILGEFFLIFLFYGYRSLLR